MIPDAARTATQPNDILIRRSEILQAINQLNSREWYNHDRSEILDWCAETLLLHTAFPAICVGALDPSAKNISAVSYFIPSPKEKAVPLIFRKKLTTSKEPNHPAAISLKKNAKVVSCNIFPRNNLSLSGHKIAFQSYCALPLWHQERTYGVIVIYSEKPDGFHEQEIDFLESTITDFSLALYAHDVSQQLQFERDFTTEIIDTIQALMVSISPCGKILRFNLEAEKVTGYCQDEVVDRYWVDVLLSPDNRLHYQKLVSRLLRQDPKNLNFRAMLQTKQGEKRTIDWHNSIKPDIDEGTVGMVLFGLDVTEQLAADQAYSEAIAKWENIFSAIQDPALIVSRKGTIIDANHATFSASRKTRDQVIGQSVCKILHGGMKNKGPCPLEQLLKTGNSRILHTELRGLNGDFLLTISPLKDSAENDDAILLVARDMTEEERLKAEAIRAAQLASIGELAAGVAHEINNPINGILNYAQMLNDISLDQKGYEITERIIAESKRITKIVRNLLNFSRHGSENPEPVSSKSLLAECTELVIHQLQKEQISFELELIEPLPLVLCNASQIKQVILNVISNSRYALNQKFPHAHPDKKIVIKGIRKNRGKTSYVRLIITDYGTGIEQHILERIFDPFFSTKPNGEGTGLGLSISYGLIRDNGGYMRVSSETGSHTSMIIDLPVVFRHGDSHVA